MLWKERSGYNKALFRHDLQVKSGDSSAEFTQFAFLTCTTQQDLLCTGTFTTVTNPAHYSNERWSSPLQQAVAGSDILTLLRRSSVFLDNSQTPVSALITTNSLDIFFDMYEAAVSPGDICFLFLFLFLRLPDASHSDICIHACTSSGENTEELQSSVHVWKRLKREIET